MPATIQNLNMTLPYCDARSDSDIPFVFRPPAPDEQTDFRNKETI